MGIIIGKLRRKKTSYEILENLDKQIKSIEDIRRSTEQTQQKIIGKFIILSVGAYLLTAVLYYFCYFPHTLYNRLLCLIPFVIVPIVIFFIKIILTWYYKRKITHKQKTLINLREEKQKILEKVMETETYKVAKTILDKFGSETPIRKLATTNTELITPANTSMNKIVATTASTGLRQRILPIVNQQPNLAITPVRPIQSVVGTTITLKPRNVHLQPISAVVANTSLQMPRAILPKERSVFDKMVDYLIGDGPSNRYALICNTCFGHNGMAFKEEFEYISFRCCYCYTMNPARKKHPIAPNLTLQPFRSTSGSDDTSDSEKFSSSDTDSEAKTPLPTIQHQDKSNGVPEIPLNSESVENSQEELTSTDIDTETETKIETISDIDKTIELKDVIEDDHENKKEIEIEDLKD